MKEFENIIVKFNKDRCICNGTCDGECNSNPILIGDVLEKISRKQSGAFKLMGFQECTVLWYHCGFTRSLQEIIMDIKECCDDCGLTTDFTMECALLFKLNPSGKELLEYLIKIGL